MNEQTTKLIEQLAQKLGTTTEYLWAVLIKQAPISAATELVYLILVIIMGVVLFKIHKRLSDKDVYYDEEEAAIVPMIIGGLLWTVFFIASFLSIGDMINGFFNPEYWALREVLDSVK